MRKITQHTKLSFVLMLIIIQLSGSAQDLKSTLDLEGKWKFMIGDNPEWSEQNVDDSDWDKIYVPGSWESQGFHGYDGYAWYRKTIIIPNLSAEKKYYLKLGFIDDVDQVYINDILVGKTGFFPPRYSTAYKAKRMYPIPQNILRETNKITIAVRVYDDVGEGGIIHGTVGLWEDSHPLTPDLDLQGAWKFKTGNCHIVSNEQGDFSGWDEILVPGTWENQGYKEFDGIACYVKEVALSGQFDGKRMVLLLGRIDDLDMVYINGSLIGQSGAFEISTVESKRDMYYELRGYYIPEGILNHNGNNTIQVKVLDWWGQGGIWEGAVGLIEQENYINYWRSNRNASY